MGSRAILGCTLATLVLLCARPALEAAGHHVQARSAETEFEQITQLLGVSQGTVVADVGAGSGSWSFPIGKGSRRAGPWVRHGGERRPRRGDPTDPPRWER